MLQFGGIFGLADVELNSDVDRFLNVFVNKYSSMGHKGLFLDGSTIAELELCNFEIVSAESIPCPWSFKHKGEAIAFIKLLFGLDLADENDIDAGINDYFGFHSEDGKFLVDWELFYIKAVKNRETYL